MLIITTMKYTLTIHTMLISTSVGMFIQKAVGTAHIHWLSLRSHGTLLLSYTLYTYHTCIALCLFSFFFSFVTPTAKQGLDIGTSRGKQKHIHPSQLNASLVLSRSMWNIVDHTLPIPPCSITPAWGHPYNPRLL